MKKIALFCGMLLSLGFVACDDMLPNPPAQSQPEVPVFTGADLTVSQADYGVNTPIDLGKYLNAGEKAPVLDVTKLENFPSNYNLSFKMEIAATDQFSKVASVDAAVTDGIAYVTPSALNNAIREIITKNPSERTVYARFAAYGNDGTATVRLGGKDVYYLTAPYKIQPIHEYTVEQRYFLVGSFCGWDVTRGIELNNIDPSLDVYDSPIFSVKVDVTEDMLPFDWKVVPVSAVNAGNWQGAMGVAPAEAGALNGTLVFAPETETEAGTVTNVGPYLFTVNIEEMTYDVKYAIPFLYVAGAGTSPSNFARMGRLTTDNYVNYRGVAPLRGNFFLLGQDSLTGTAFMQAADTEPSTEKLVTSYTMGAFASSSEGTRFPVENRGVYFIDANTTLMTLRATELQTVSLVGEFNGWKEKEPFQLTHSSDFKTWTGTVELKGQFKVNTNNDWTVDFGAVGDHDGIPVTPGTAMEIVYKGKNMDVEQGTYEVTVSFAYPATITLVRK